MSNVYCPLPTFEVVSDEFFAHHIGSGRVSGIAGRDNITVGNVTVKSQQIGVVNKASNAGERVYVRLVGLD
jgi:hypothetical protein